MPRRQMHASEVIRSALAATAPDRIGDLDHLDPDLDVWRALDLDSLDHLNVLTLISDTTGVDVPERDYPRLISFRQLCEHVDRVLPHASASSEPNSAAAPER